LEFYQLHAKPKSIWVYQLDPKARQHLSAVCLPPDLAPYECHDRLDYPFSTRQSKSLLAAFASVPDPRGYKGRRHRSLASILAIASAAMIAGNNTFLAIGQFAASLTQQQLGWLGASRDPKSRKYLTPSEPVIRRAIQRIDPQALDAVVCEWLTSHEDPQGEKTLAADGKAVRTVSKINGQPFHLFSVLSHQTHLVQKQIKIPDKTNEIPALKVLFKDLPIQGALVTVDAIHTQRQSAIFLVEKKKADYMMTVKNNQPKLLKKLLKLCQQNSFFPSGLRDGPRHPTGDHQPRSGTTDPKTVCQSPPRALEH
jgi:hypothetical protein